MHTFTGTLSTKDGKIVDESGLEVILKGFALSGFESSFTMTGDLTDGSDSIAHDWQTSMYRCLSCLCISLQHMYRVLSVNACICNYRSLLPGFVTVLPVL